MPKRQDQIDILRLYESNLAHAATTIIIIVISLLQQEQGMQQNLEMQPEREPQGEAQPSIKDQVKQRLLAIMAKTDDVDQTRDLTEMLQRADMPEAIKGQCIHCHKQQIFFKDPSPIICSK